MKTIASFGLLLVCNVALLSSEDIKFNSPADRPISPGSQSLAPNLRKSATMETMSTAVNKLTHGFNRLQIEQTRFFNSAGQITENIAQLEATCDARLKAQQKEHAEIFAALENRHLEQFEALKKETQQHHRVVTGSAITVTAIVAITAYFVGKRQK